MKVVAHPSSAREFGRGTARRGFTLIELILVLALLTLVVAAIAPNMGAFLRGRQASYTASQFIGMARYARSQAATEARAYRISYDAGTKTFTLTADNGGGTFEEVQSDLGRQLKVPDTVNVEMDVSPKADTAGSGNAVSAGTYIEFQPTGLTDVAKVRFINQKTQDVSEVACLTPTELFQSTGGAK